MAQGIDVPCVLRELRALRVACCVLLRALRCVVCDAWCLLCVACGHLRVVIYNDTAS